MKKSTQIQEQKQEIDTSNMTIEQLKENAKSIATCELCHKLLASCKCMVPEEAYNKFRKIHNLVEEPKQTL